MVVADPVRTAVAHQGSDVRRVERTRLEVNALDADSTVLVREVRIGTLSVIAQRMLKAQGVPKLVGKTRPACFSTFVDVNDDDAPDL